MNRRIGTTDIALAEATLMLTGREKALDLPP